MNAVRLLEPRELWENFYQLTQVPRPSHHEELIQEYIFNFGKKLGLETIKDKVGNIIIRKPASNGWENRRGVVLQSHLDMVPQKNNDKVHDFLNDPIEAYVDGDWVTANGTTLGADNGIGAAAAMAILASSDIEHGPLEALFTATEETGLTGAQGLEAGVLKGGIMLNLDSEEDGELCVGCAGGLDVSVTFNYSEELVPDNYEAFLLEVSGLKGGHSGMDIILQRGNSNKLFFRLLQKASESVDFRLSSVEGGNMRNAIPRETLGVLVVEKDLSDRFKTIITEEFEQIKKEIASVDPKAGFSLTPTAMPTAVIDIKTQNNLINSVVACPNGVVRMSDEIPGLVETSSNMAAVRSDANNNTVSVLFLMRSSVDSAKYDLFNCVKGLFAGLAGASVVGHGSYSGWKPNPKSAILSVMSKVYESKFGKKPEVKAIHAGLECGIIGGTYPELDMISFGPTICFPHSPDEKVNIETVKRFWEFLLETLKNIPLNLK